MALELRIVSAALAGMFVMSAPALAPAQDAKKAPAATQQSAPTPAQAPAPAAAASAATPWNSQVKADPSGSLTLDDKQLQTSKRVDAFFNELTNMRGTFVQTGADGKRMRGRFYVKKPGRFRFDYSPPSRQVVMSDGRFLRIYDQDIDKEDALELDNTPFRVLLKSNVDLIKDARISEVQESEDLIVVTLQDKAPDTPGRIRLLLVKKPQIELKEWVTTDAQGLDTRMELAEINRTEEIDAGLFKPLPMKINPR